MAYSSFNFSLESFDLHVGNRAQLGDASESIIPLPTDFEDIVDLRGDRFRDSFTRICLYLAKRNIPADSTANGSVIVGSQYGNLEAMLRLQRQAMNPEIVLSAQQFPHATTSSASTFVNIAHRITGGNATLNAGPVTPIIAFQHALLHVCNRPAASSYLFVGDTYCPIAFDDLRKTVDSERAVTPGVAFARLQHGLDMTAEFAFGPDSDSLVGRQTVVSHDCNGALALHELLARVTCSSASAITLILGQGSRAAAMRIMRKEHA